MNAEQTSIREGSGLRWLLIALVVIVAFFASYRFAAANSANSAAKAAVAAPALASAPAANAPAGAPAADPAAGGAGCACCGGAQPPAGEQTSKAAAVEGGVQKISVDLSKGYYDPTQIELKAGVPAEITFGQGSGCMAQVQSQELGFFEDLTGGPKTVKIPALKAGTYPFSCGMQMVFGAIVVK